ncbi:MAG: hypothetical protein LBP68_00740 [Acidobacteriota bacterium]|jgi:hypothetical protein|nr:hypothetical protein [Acidobacteriota bacterium]
MATAKVQKKAARVVTVNRIKTKDGIKDIPPTRKARKAKELTLDEMIDQITPENMPSPEDYSFGIPMGKEIW